MNYKLEGSGKTLVFIHGLSDSLLYWEPLASSLKNDYQILRVDLRGHGESELGDDEISIGLFSEDLHSLLCELNIDESCFIGLSLGGAVALDFAIRYPQRTSSLIVMSSYCKVDEHLANVLNQFKSALENSFEEFYDLILPMVLCPDVIKANQEELEMLKQIVSQSANVEAYIQAIDASFDFNVEENLSQIDVPTLVLAGKQDEITTLKSQKEIHSKIKGSKLIVFDDAKHNLLVGKNVMEILDIIKMEL